MIFQQAPEEDGASAAAVAATSDPGSDLDGMCEAILRLPNEHREFLVMQIIGGFSTVEIAHELGLSFTTVLARLFRVRNKPRVRYGAAAATETPVDAVRYDGAFRDRPWGFR